MSALRGFRAGDILRVWSADMGRFWEGKLLCSSPDGETLLIADLHASAHLDRTKYGRGAAIVRGVSPDDVTLIRMGGNPKGGQGGKGKRRK
jgi:hypothetical protein